MGHIEEIRDFLLTRGRVTASFTGSDSAYETTRAKLGEWLSTMRDELLVSEPITFETFDSPPREGLAGPIQIAHLCTRNTGTALFTSGFYVAYYRCTSHTDGLYSK